MNTTNKYLDRCKIALDVKSDYALAKALDVATQRLSNYRAERVSADPEMCLKIAEILKLKPIQVMADIQKDSAKSEKTRALWKKYSSAAALLLWVATTYVANATSVQGTHLQDVSFYIKHTEYTYGTYYEVLKGAGLNGREV